MSLFMTPPPELPRERAVELMQRLAFAGAGWGGCPLTRSEAEWLYGLARAELHRTAPTSNGQE